MNEEVEFVLSSAMESMEFAIVHLDKELLKIRAGKANPSMLDGVMVDYYDALTPLAQVANVNTLDARTLTIQPWERNLLDKISTAITNANLGLNPQNNGELILINVPPLTEDRRKGLVKKAKAEGESAKVSIRNVRKEANDEIKVLQKDGLPEDEAKGAEAKIQEMTDKFVSKIDSVIVYKENDIMKV